MTHVAEHPIFGIPPVRPPQPRRAARVASAPQCRDDRWPAVAARLAALRADRRRSVRIVDVDCGSGRLLLCAVRLARALGFTAIEARGVDPASALIERATKAAAALRDPAIGITFETGDYVDALRDEARFPADIVVWHGCHAGCDAAGRRAVEGAAARAGTATITDGPVQADDAR
ncbi:SAM-dependent methyltransferase [Sphingomonas sp. RB3P16]|uniref:SAM-dependent methyltransferase n=1 Tax=Parasphingomonas frigoris TaxID=3096163 RepID=UPI002FC8972D